MRLCRMAGLSCCFARGAAAAGDNTRAFTLALPPDRGKFMRKKKKVGMLTKVLVAVFAVYATFTMVSLQFQISQKKEEQAELQAQVAEQTLRNAEVKALLESENSDEYVARIARDKLGYISPGERVFVDISSK